MDIGIIGIGLMGKAFVERYLSQGYIVRVFNRTHNNVKDLAESGVTICTTADELINLSSTIILMVSNAEAINSLLQLDDQEDKQEALQGKTILQMATISPSQSKEIGEAITSHGGDYLDAQYSAVYPRQKQAH